jgi:hypothetical protein
MTGHPAARLLAPARPAAVLAAAVLAAAALLAAGCGTVTARPGPSGPSVPSVPPSLATSLVAAGGSWAAVVMGGSPSQDNAFWQLFVRPGTSTAWKVATPPGVATNGGLVMAGLGSTSLLAGFRPGVDLTFSALITTGNSGASWSPGGVLDPGLADVPDALAAAPGSGRLIALLAAGRAEQSADSGTTWAALATRQSLAASPAARQCGLTTLTAASYTPSGAPLLAGTCARPGTAGIFTYSGGQWRPDGPALPAALAAQPVEVLGLRTSQAAGQAGTGKAASTALLVAGSGTAQSILAAWSGDGGAQWTVSAPARAGAAGVRASGFGAAGAAWVIFADGTTQSITGPGAAWRTLPPLPASTQTLAYGPAGALDALAVGDGKPGPGSELTIWQLPPAAGAWTREQAITVPIQYGSSG